MRDMDAERFKKKIRKTGSGCWVWEGAHAHGNPVMRVRGKTTQARRWSYRQKFDLSNAHIVVDCCGNRSCVNPDHLRPVTRSEAQRHRRGKDCKESINHLIRTPWRTISNAELGIDSYQFGVAV